MSARMPYCVYIMCGITGYIGQKEATEIILEGLHALEYRGYDSAGIAVFKDGSFSVAKAAGRVAVLEERLAAQKASRTEIEICAFVDGVLVGSAGNHALSTREKLRHRADFGISILREYWGQGIGAALTGACIDCAKEAGFRQLELEVVGDNETAVRLYKKYGFMEYGRNPRGFLTRDGRWQELVLMRLELEDTDVQKIGAV